VGCSIYLSSILSCYQLYFHVCSASSVRNNSLEVAGLHVIHSTITSLWFYNDSCVRDSFLNPSFDWRKEHGIHRVSVNAKYFRRFLLPLCKFALSSRPLWKASRPFAGELRVYTYFTLGGTTGLEGNILHKTYKIEESWGGIFFGARTVINFSGNIPSKMDKRKTLKTEVLFESDSRNYIVM